MAFPGTETVVIKHKSWDGTSYDEDGQPLYTTSTESVSGVLVSPGDPSDVNADARPDGKYVNYTIYMPKSWSGKLTDIESITVRGGKPLPILGYPDRYNNEICPTIWDCEIHLQGSEG